MSDANFVTIFDLTRHSFFEQSPVLWVACLAILLFNVLFLLLWLYIRKSFLAAPRKIFFIIPLSEPAVALLGQIRQFMGSIFTVCCVASLGLAALFVLLFIGLDYVEYSALKSSAEKGESVKLEGNIEKFHPQIPRDKGIESFEVRGVKFICDPRTVTTRFNQTRAQGSPLTDGAYVRIWYVNVKHLDPYAIIRIDLLKR